MRGPGPFSRVSVVQWLPFPPLFLVAAPLKWSSQKRVPVFSRVTEQLRSSRDMGVFLGCSKNHTRILDGGGCCIALLVAAPHYGSQMKIRELCVEPLSRVPSPPHPSPPLLPPFLSPPLPSFPLPSLPFPSPPSLPLPSPPLALRIDELLAECQVLTALCAEASASLSVQLFAPAGAHWRRGRVCERMLSNQTWQMGQNQRDPILG